MRANAELQAEFWKALDLEMATVGPQKFLVEPVAQAFAKRGDVSLSTLYRWGQKWRASPRPAVAVDKVIKEADRRAKRERKVREKKVKEQAAEVVSTASALIPAPPTVDSIAAAGGMVSWVQELRDSIALAKQLVDQARDPADPKRIRLVRQALMASEHLGKCLERAGRLSETSRDINSFERFNQSMIEEIQKESPEVARRVLRRLGEWLNTNYPIEERRRHVV